MLAGRLSRAMLFASATLVSCDQGAKPVATEGSAAIKAPSTTWKLHGVVKDSQGQPLRGARVSMFLEEQPQTEPASFTATADAQGRYQVEGAIIGRYNVTFEWAGNAGNAFYKSPLVTFLSTSDKSLDATLDPSLPAMPYGAPPARRRVV